MFFKVRYVHFDVEIVQNCDYTLCVICELVITNIVL